MFWVDIRESGKAWRSIGCTKSFAVASVWCERAKRHGAECRIVKQGE